MHALVLVVQRALLLTYSLLDTLMLRLPPSLIGLLHSSTKPGFLDTNMRSWVASQVAEYLGEEDATLIDFVITQLKQHVMPADLVEQLATLLDEDAEEFAIKLWRKLILSTLSL
jgi:PWI domain